MKFSINAIKLYENLLPVTRALGKSEESSTVLLAVEDGVLTLAASDGGLGISRNVDISQGENGQIRVMGKMFFDFVRSLPDTNLDIFQENNQLQIQSDSLHLQLKTINLPNPVSPVEQPDNEALSLQTEVFASVAKKVEKAASRDESRPILTGILVSVEEGALTMVATDSYRLAVARASVVSADWQALVPAKAVSEIVRIAEPGTLKIQTKGSKLLVQSGKTILNCRLLDGTFPNYEQLIPSQFNYSVTMNVEALMDITSRFSILAGANAPLSLQFSQDHLEIGVDSGEIGKGSEKTSSDWKSEEEFVIGYNPQYLREGLQLVGEKAELRMVDEIRPSLLVNPEDENFLYLLMPIRLNG